MLNAVAYLMLLGHVLDSYSTSGANSQSAGKNFLDCE